MSERILYAGCPLCAAPDCVDWHSADCSRHALYQPGLSAQIQWKRCRACAHVFTDGYYTEEACRLIFARTHGAQQVGHDVENQRLVSARMIDKVLPFIAAGPWLDVGFGNASLLLTAREYGFEPIGIDLRADNVGALSRLGVQAYCVALNDLALVAPCAVISMADVLEHMPYPKEGLSAAHRLLDDDGVLFVSMPNSESAVWLALDQGHSNPYWGEIEHYHNFSRSRLYALLAETGFMPLRYGISERYRAGMEVIARKR